MDNKNCLPDAFARWAIFLPLKTHTANLYIEIGVKMR